MAWNPAALATDLTITNANRTISLDSIGSGGVRSTHGLSAGKWYFEVEFTARTVSNQFVGFASTAHNIETINGFDAYSWGLQLLNTAGGSGACLAWHNNSSVAHSVRIPGTGGAIVRVALDLDNKKVWYSTNGSDWDGGDPTDPVTGDYANSFTSHTEDLYVCYYGARDADNQSIATLNVSADELSYSAPSGYSPIAEGWPLDRAIASATLTFTGQAIDQTGGIFNVILDVVTATNTFIGQPITFSGGSYQSTDIQLDHLWSSPSLILRERTDYGLSRVLSATGFVASSGLLNQVLTTGKWYIEARPNTIIDGYYTYSYQNVRLGIARRDAVLTELLGNYDEWMLSFGAWNSSMRWHHAGNEIGYYSGSGSSTGYFGIALDLTDSSNGKMWAHYNGTWLDGNPVTGTSPSVSGLTGAWCFAISLGAQYQIDIGETQYNPSGYTELRNESQFSVTGLWSNASVVTSSESTLTLVDCDLVLTIGSHLLRDAVWEKRTTYFIGLLTSMDPVVEVSNGAYTRQYVYVGDSYWDANLENLSSFVFPSFNATVVGWALYAGYHPASITGIGHDLVLKRELPSPIVCTTLVPGIELPPHSLSWSVT